MASPSAMEKARGVLKDVTYVEDYAGPARPQVAAPAVIEPLRQVPKARIERERGEEQARSIGPPAEQD